MHNIVELLRQDLHWCDEIEMLVALEYYVTMQLSGRLTQAEAFVARIQRNLSRQHREHLADYPLFLRQVNKKLRLSVRKAASRQIPEQYRMSMDEARNWFDFLARRDECSYAFYRAMRQAPAVPAPLDRRSE
jgi:hypothetical protein